MSQTLERVFVNGERVPDYFFDKKTGVIYLVKSLEGKKVKVSTGVKMPAVNAAKRVANQKLKAKINAKKTRITPLIKDELPLWRAVKVAEKVSPATMKNIDQAIKRIEGFWGSMYPHEIKREKINEWFQWLEWNYPGQLKEKPIKYLRNFARYLGEKTYNDLPLLPVVPVIADPDFKEVRASRRKKKGRIFTAEEFKRLFAVADDTEKLVALFMYTMATRIEETLTLRFGEQIILGDAPEYRWEHGQNKMDLWGSHDLHPALIPLLRDRVIKVPGPLVFPQRWDKTKPLKAQQIDWADWRKRADLGWHWTSHTFRHTCLSNLFNDETLPQAIICQLYRVSLAVAMSVYIKPTKKGREKLRAAIEVHI